MTVFVIALLALFQPFCIYNIQEIYKWNIILGYGDVTAFVEIILLMIVMPLLPQIFREDNWTVCREVIWVKA